MRSGLNSWEVKIILMKEPISVNFDTQTVSARELYTELEVTDRFSRWFERMTAYGFTENEDFTSVKSSTVVNNGAERELQDYELSVDMAKHICMVQRTEKAKEVRQYLIDLEKAWNTPEQVMARALKMADKTIESLKGRVLELETSVQQMDKVIGDMTPKANYVDVILKSKSTVLVTQIAQDYGMSAKAFNKELKDLGIQHKVGGQWILYAKYLPNGYVQSDTIPIEHKDGSSGSVMHTKWTQKGRLFLYEELKKHNVLPIIER